MQPGRGTSDLSRKAALGRVRIPSVIGEYPWNRPMDPTRCEDMQAGGGPKRDPAHAVNQESKETKNRKQKEQAEGTLQWHIQITVQKNTAKKEKSKRHAIGDIGIGDRHTEKQNTGTQEELQTPIPLPRSKKTGIQGRRER